MLQDSNIACGANETRSVNCTGAIIALQLTTFPNQSDMEENRK
jgi:hypothetical protein